MSKSTFFAAIAVATYLAVVFGPFRVPEPQSLAGFLAVLAALNFGLGVAVGRWWIAALGLTVPIVAYYVIPDDGRGEGPYLELQILLGVAQALVVLAGVGARRLVEARRGP